MACDRCEELEEEVIQLKETLYGRRWNAPLEVRLTRQEEEFLQCLVAFPGPRSPAVLFDAINRGNADDVNKLVNVIASKVRRKLRPFGCDFVTVYGRGYLLEEPVRQRLLNWNAEPQNKAA